jgi:hypothetical protein
MAWSMVGIHQNLRTELQYRNKAGYWISFLAFVAIYFYGFMFNDSTYDSTLNKYVYTAPKLTLASSVYYHLLFVSGLFFFITQFLLLIERKGENDYQNFLKLLRNGRLKSLWVEAPLWFSAAIAFAISMFVIMLIQGLGLNETSNFVMDVFHSRPRYRSHVEDPSTIETTISNTNIILCYISTLLLLARDIFFSRYLLYKTKFKNKLLVVAIYYVIMYWAIPGLFMVGNHDEYSMIGIFLPFYASVAWTSFFALLLQAGGAWWWHKYSFYEDAE